MNELLLHRGGVLTSLAVAEIALVDEERAWVRPLSQHGNRA
jgi:hypothetical protein